MVVFGKLAKLLLCYKRYVLIHPGLHLPVPSGPECDHEPVKTVESTGSTVRKDAKV